MFINRTLRLKRAPRRISALITQHQIQSKSSVVYWRNHKFISIIVIKWCPNMEYALQMRMLSKSEYKRRYSRAEHFDREISKIRMLVQHRTSVISNWLYQSNGYRRKQYHNVSIYCWNFCSDNWYGKEYWFGSLFTFGALHCAKLAELVFTIRLSSLIRDF